jgi:hypothetical protein
MTDYRTNTNTDSNSVMRRNQWYGNIGSESGIWNKKN